MDVKSFITESTQENKEIDCVFKDEKNGKGNKLKKIFEGDKKGKKKKGKKSKKKKNEKMLNEAMNKAFKKLNKKSKVKSQTSKNMDDERMSIYMENAELKTQLKCMKGLAQLSIAAKNGKLDEGLLMLGISLCNEMEDKYDNA